MMDLDYVRAEDKGRHGWARTLATLLLIVAALAVVVALTQRIVLPLLKSSFSDAPEHVRPLITMGLASLIFGAGLAVLLVCVRFIHKRPIRTLLTSRSKFRFGHLAVGFGVSATLVLAGGFWIDPSAGFRLQGEPAVLIVSALALLLAFALQSSTEEILIRGYLLQVSYRAVRSAWIAGVVSVLAFTALHFGYGLESAASSLVFAIGLTLIVLRLGGLELAIGAHVGNNLMIVLFLQDLSDINPESPAGFNWAEFGVSSAVMVILVLIAMSLPRSVDGPKGHRKLRSSELMTTSP